MMAKQHITFAVGLYATTVGLGATGVDVGPIDVPALWSDWSGADPAQLLLGTVVVAAGALVPDLDHPNSTLTKKLGVAGKVVYPVIRLLSGGHRKGMHSIFLVAAMGLVFFLANFGTPVAAVLVALSALLVTRFVLPFGIGKRKNVAYLVALGLVALLFAVDGVMSGYWLPVAAAAGPLLHDVGDMLTEGKVRFFHPVSSVALRSPIRFPTGGFFEVELLGRVFVLWALAALVVFVGGPLLDTPFLS